MSPALLILKIYTTFKDVQMMLTIFFDISTGFRFSKISVKCSVHLCGCPCLALLFCVTCYLDRSSFNFCIFALPVIYIKVLLIFAVFAFHVIYIINSLDFCRTVLCSLALLFCVSCYLDSESVWFLHFLRFLLHIYIKFRWIFAFFAFHFIYVKVRLIFACYI